MADSQSSREGQRIVLVVDDEEINREILGNILQERYRVLFAGDGIEAMNIIRKEKMNISVVLLDISMPNMNGYEVLATLRADDILRHIPVMVLTGNKEAEVSMLERGASDFIVKPFDRPDLILARVAKTIRLAEDTYIIRETEKDSLTELSNISHFQKLCKLENDRFAKDSIKPSYIYIDILNMKAYNNRYGYAEGDRMLCRVAWALRDTFEDLPVCRISEDHFAAFAPAKATELLLKILQERVKPCGNGTNIEFHAGIFTPNDNEDVDSITALDFARIACQTIDGDYSISIKTFDDAMLKKYDNEQRVLENFEKALSEHWIKVYYQPIVRGITGEVCNFEALARWIDPELGMLSPGVFIPVIEDYKLGARMDLYMVEEVCREMKERTLGGITQVPVSVNFSRTDFDQCDMVKEITEIADRYKMPHDMLIIEVTESAFGHNQKFLQEQIQRFHEQGFKVWMDDFGDGYASLNVLQDNDFDLIKLDIGFMRNFDPNGKNGKILKDIIRMAQHLGIHTLSEGSESEEQVKFLQEIGCEKIQGFYYGKPRPTSESIQNIKNDTALAIESTEVADYFENKWNFNYSEYLSNNIPGAILVYKANDEEEILYANNELVSMFECSSLREFLEYTKCSFKNIVHPDDLAITEETIKRQQAGNNSQHLDFVDYRIITKKGTIKTIEDIGHLVHNEKHGDIYFVSLYDIATKKSVSEESK